MSASSSTKTSGVITPQTTTIDTSSGNSDKCSTTFVIKDEKVPSNNSLINSRISGVWVPTNSSTPKNDKDDATSPVTASHIGHRVCVGGTKVGILRFFGEIELTSGLFCGVELDEPAGLNDGSVQGVRYFSCKPHYGIIAPVGIVKPLPGGSWQQTRRKQSPDSCSKRRRSATFCLEESGPYSLLEGITTPEDASLEPMEKDVDPGDESGRDMFLSHNQMQQASPASTPTPSSTTSNAAPWECWGHQRSCSTGSSQSRHQSQLSKQSSFEQDESLGILTPDQLCSANCLTSIPPRQQSQQQQQQAHATHQLSKQSSFELDESLGILTPDQMLDFTVCADSASVGRTPSFEDMGAFLLGDYKGERPDDMLPDRLPSGSDGPSSSNYPSSEFPQFPIEPVEHSRQPPDEVMNTDDEHYLVSKAEDVSMQELELLSNDATPEQQQQQLQQHCAPNEMLELTMCCASEDMSDNVCQAVSKSSDGDFTPASIRVGQDISDRTLSPEDLPMDAPFQEVIGEILQKAEATSESGRDTAGLSGATSAGPSSRSSAAPPAPSSFVTSVTSITSLDNGYQGDGEWSRPASRGADHSPTSHRVIKLKTSAADPMTDSDFFTESDADMHDELAAGSGRGDRRAQVIDGTLYGANLHASGAVLIGHQHQRCPSFTASINEEMESSGVYSDLERRPEDMTSDGKEYPNEDRNNVEADFSPDVSTKTVSSRSEHSQVKDLPTPFTTIISQPVIENTKDDCIPMDTTETVSSNDMLTENNLKNQQVSNPMTVVEDVKTSLELTPIQTDVSSSVTTGSVKSPTATTFTNSVGNKTTKEESNYQLKKYKMPKRNVVSKIKAMIESSPSVSGTRGGNASTEDENQENRRPTRSPSKSLRKSGGRWDAVMNKIAQGQAEQKLKPRSLKEVKSKVFANISTTPTQQAEGTPRRSTDRTRKSSSSSLGHSAASRALKENSPLKTKSRRARTRASSTSLSQQQQAAGSVTTHGQVSSPNSSPHSSISDVSVSQNHALDKGSTKSPSSLRSSKKRDVGRSTSPLSDGSTNSTTSHVMTRSSSNHLPPLNHLPRPPGHMSAARERVLRDNMNRNTTGGNLQKQRQPRNPRMIPSNGVDKHSIGRRAASTPVKEKNGVSVTAAVDMKTPPTRKQTSRRTAPGSESKPTPLRDHNRQQQAGGGGGGGVFKSGGESLPSNKTGEVSVPSQRPPSTPQTQPLPAEILLPQLQHNSTGFEALGVLVQYLVYNLDAFSTPQLRKDLESMKTEWLKTKLELEEAKASYRRIEDNLDQEKALHHQKVQDIEVAHHQELAARDTKHSHELSELITRHEEQLTDFKNRLQEQLEKMKDHYEAELSHVDHLHSEKLEIVIADGKTHLEQVQNEHAALMLRLQNDTSQREAELRHRLTGVEAQYNGLKDQSRKLMDSMQKDKDTKLQATAGRCKELQDEVESLRTVLDLRHEELQELRKQNALLKREGEELPLALQRVAGLEAKVEDLQVQLQVKTTVERQLSQDNRVLMESFHQESKQNKRLSMHNEELQWKLKQNFEVVNVLANLTGTPMHSSMTTSLNSTISNGRRSVHGSAQSLNDIDSSAPNSQFFSNKTPSRPLSAGRSNNSSHLDISGNAAALRDEVEMSPPASPKVKGVVEKSDSVSWVVEIDETPEALLSRLVRRAGSFRGTTPPPSSLSSPAHARTLPPPKRQRCKASSLSLSSSATAIARPNVGTHTRNAPLSSSLRCRSRSVSTDSVEGVGLDYISWNPKASTPLKNNCRSVGNNQCDVLMKSNKSSLKRCGDDVYANDDNESIQNSNSSIHNLGGMSNGSFKRGVSECSNEEDSPSKSPGSSGSSDAGQKDHDRLCCHSKKEVSENITDPSATSDSLDLGDTEVLPLPPLPGSTSGDLSLLAAQPLLPMPKESAGEAMISEETSEDENDNDEINSSSDENSCSDEEETSSSSGSSSDLGPVATRGLDEDVENNSENNKKEDKAGGIVKKKGVASGQQNMSTTGNLQQYHVLLMSESGSYSATTTTMDLSWSEDMELMPSESEG